ncbi:polysaccharide export protein [Rhizobiaceae bacterium BDR2-2]|uniref:Polysaccharide export protein n=1 Tax=Ectorhizobium quercum TaxID=2965071 RepID=A0AAE3MWF2_9HYPH|nr:polysaccharide biosynthesis/export family protein [Ectorhizobium quercum]MCX8996208.1 polysaccharide export protein [Ectorhizobium quercum]MCX8998753.1 polysaccharide export protein [Ectorhizobium quercum]
MKKTGVLIVGLALTSCKNLPGDGPLASDIAEQSRQSVVSQSAARSNVVFDIVDIDTRSANLISNYDGKLLQRRFGLGGGVKRPVIGVGDQLKITIFEAGSDGLFSTGDTKQATLDIIVQPDGKAAIPYAGLVTFAGKTLEQARQSILEALANKAVEPDVIINSVGTASRNVTISGAVNSPAVVPLSLVSETIMETLAKAGGPAAQPYESYITLTRNRRTGTVLLKTLIDNPQENIYVQPGDQIFVTREPRTFTVLGAVKTNNRIEFGANDLNLLEGVAMAGGGAAEVSDMRGYFVFRYEEPDIVMDLLGRQRFNELLSKGMTSDKQGRYPIVYRFDMTKAGSLLTGQTFPVKNRDIIYASRHPSVDFVKFMNIVARPIGIAASTTGLYLDVTD